MTAWQVDLIVLAGWMRIVSPKLIEAFPNRIINLHPSLLPKYKGLHAIEQAFESGDKVTGCTVHYVNEHLDSGEIILQEEVPILANDTVETLTKDDKEENITCYHRRFKFLKKKLCVYWETIQKYPFHD